MGIQAYNLTLPTGYQAVVRPDHCPLSEVPNRLRGKKRRRYTEVRQVDGQAVLTRHIIRCPYCGKEIPAYKKGGQLVTFFEICNWAYPQQSLFEEELHIQEPQTDKKSFTCPRCGKISHPTDRQLSVKIRDVGRGIIVSWDLVSLDDLFYVGWLPPINFSGAFPLTESLCFDFSHGSVYFAFTDSRGQRIFKKDLSPTAREESLLMQVFQNRVFCRTLRRLFATRWQEAFPYTDAQLTFRHFAEMTLFTGFSPSLYHAIPYNKDSGHLDKSFREAMIHLRTSEVAMAYLKESSLPYIKSVKRMFTGDQGLLFYLRECELLWKYLQDVNLLREILGCKSRYVILSDLHTYPALETFYRDFREKKSAGILCRLLCQHVREVHSKALHYVMLGESFQESARQRFWKDHRHLSQFDFYYGDLEYPYTLPMPTPPENIPDCTVDRFHFHWLRSGFDAQIAGIHLHNCLKQWPARFDSPVAVVEQYGQLQAALQVEQNALLQALEDKNYELPAGDLKTAVTKWCARYKIDPLALTRPN